MSDTQTCGSGDVALAELYKSRASIVLKIAELEAITFDEEQEKVLNALLEGIDKTIAYHFEKTIEIAKIDASAPIESSTSAAPKEPVEVVAPAADATTKSQFGRFVVPARAHIKGFDNLGDGEE